MRRVQHWIGNLRRDLERDSKPAAGKSETRWLLFQTSSMQISAEDGSVTSSLCKRCRAALERVTPVKKTPAARMPEDARANGLWHGPDLKELSALTFCECKVINLARMHVSVKRVFLDRRSYARTSASEAPLYHERNVVAYPQNPDAALTALGMKPQTFPRC